MNIKFSKKRFIVRLLLNPFLYMGITLIWCGFYLSQLDGLDSAELSKYATSYIGAGNSMASLTGLIIGGLSILAAIRHALSRSVTFTSELKK